MKFMCFVEVLFSAVVSLSVINADSGDNDVTDHKRIPVADNEFAYYELADDGNHVFKTCPFVFGQQMLFDEDLGQCVPQHNRAKRQITVGSFCTEATQCGGNGMYCNSNQRCDCLSTYVADGTVCRQKINPGTAGCQSNVQCTAVTADSYCDMGSGGTGTCRCTNQRDPIQTGDGFLCTFSGKCPTNGDGPKYISVDGTVLSCSTATNLCPPGYDCICTTSACDNTEAKFCCPSRGLACMQNYDEGSGQLAGATRWWYNSITGNCQRFNFRGNGGNANNFQSQAECTTYCGTFCRRGNPEYLFTINTPQSGSILLTTSNARTCSSDSSCADSTNYFCDTVGTNSYCCPRPLFICTQRGGLDYSGNTGTVYINNYDTANGPTAGYDPGTSNPNRPNSQARFYYDTTQRRCLAFTFLGQGGNYNNFITQAQCDRFCAQTLCDAGEPLKDQTGITNLACSSSSSCPTNYLCSSNSVCCPNAQTVCTLPQAVGTCPNSVEKWWYNAATANCQRFLYSGCQGNANNFDTQLTCQNFCRDTNVQPQCPQGKSLRDSFDRYIICGGTGTTTSCPGNYYCYYDGSSYGCCPTKSYTCSQTYDQGSICSPAVSRWYYDSSQRRCLSFQYYGCDGNANNFATQQDCGDYCGIGGCPDGGEPYRETGTGTFRTCSGGAACPSTHYCTQVTLGSSTSYNYCCPTKAYNCGLPRDSGNTCSASALTRYYFNTASRNCEAFSYNGCGGNRNSFSTASVCLNYCNSAGCPPGTVALRDGVTNTLTVCNTAQANICPSSYTCVQSNLLGQGICCGVPQSVGRCPSGLSSYYDAFSNSELQCQPNTVGACPLGYNCIYSATSLAYYCCGTAQIQCPQGGTVLIDSITNVARQCTPGVTGACPASYTCQPSNINIQNIVSTTGYCCGSGGICGNGGSPLIVGNNPTVCSAGQNTCQSGYECAYSSANSQYYCCTPSISAIAQVCGSGQPYVVANAPVVCTQGSTSTGCPGSYTCQYYQNANQFYCCQAGGTIATTTGCPPNYSPILVNNVAGQYRYCSPTIAGSCSVGNCLWSDSMQRFICCLSGSAQPTQSTCPNGLPTTVVCTNGACPSGQSCTTMANGQFCCPRTSSCPAGDPYSPGTNLAPTTCAASTQCPNGYECRNSQCCPTAAAVCSQAMSQGFACTGATAQTRYYSSGGQCVQFSYLGCGGNSNNFAQATDCQLFCGGATNPTSICPTGQEAYNNQFTNQPQSCVPGQVACPSTYTCTLSNNVYYCCRIIGTTQPVQFCPAGLQVLNTGGTPQFCNPAILSSCATPGYQCYPTSSGTSYCCGTGVPVGTGCPNNVVAQMVGAAPVSCTPGAFSGCSAGYSCTFSTTYNRNICCLGSTGDQYGCPQGTSYLYQNTQIPLACQPFGPSCPGGYQCLQSTRYSGYQCCSLTGGSAGISPVITPVTTQFLAPGDSGCSSDTQCQSTGEPNARCQSGQCLCSSNLLVYSRRCVGSCPWPYRNLNGVCIISSFDATRRRDDVPCKNSSLNC